MLLDEVESRSGLWSIVPTVCQVAALRLSSGSEVRDGIVVVTAHDKCRLLLSELARFADVVLVGSRGCSTPWLIQIRLLQRHFVLRVTVSFLLKLQELAFGAAGGDRAARRPHLNTVMYIALVLDCVDGRLS